jgi:hypothetical protein
MIQEDLIALECVLSRMEKGARVEIGVFLGSAGELLVIVHEAMAWRSTNQLTGSGYVDSRILL